MATKKPSRPITPTGQGRIALIPLYQRLQQAGFTRHAACAILELARDGRNIQIMPPLPEGRFIPRGEGLALKTADGIRDVARVYLRVRSPKKSPPPMPWRPEWHAMREVVLRAAHDTAANYAMPKRRGPRAELLSLVPLSMSTIDRLEAEGKFPGRIRLEPTNRVAWLRREVTGYLRHLGRRRQSAPQEDHVEPARRTARGCAA